VKGPKTYLEYLDLTQFLVDGGSHISNVNKPHAKLSRYSPSNINYCVTVLRNKSEKVVSVRVLFIFLRLAMQALSVVKREFVSILTQYSRHLCTVEVL
jgi:hypothetical protein